MTSLNLASRFVSILLHITNPRSIVLSANPVCREGYPRGLSCLVCLAASLDEENPLQSRLRALPVAELQPTTVKSVRRSFTRIQFGVSRSLQRSDSATLPRSMQPPRFKSSDDHPVCGGFITLSHDASCRARQTSIAYAHSRTHAQKNRATSWLGLGHQESQVSLAHPKSQRPQSGARSQW